MGNFVHKRNNLAIEVRDTDCCTSFPSLSSRHIYQDYVSSLISYSVSIYYLEMLTIGSELSHHMYLFFQICKLRERTTRSQLSYNMSLFFSIKLLHCNTKIVRNQNHENEHIYITMHVFKIMSLIK